MSSYTWHCFFPSDADILSLQYICMRSLFRDPNQRIRDLAITSRLNFNLYHLVFSIGLDWSVLFAEVGLLLAYIWVREQFSCVLVHDAGLWICRYTTAFVGIMPCSRLQVS